MKDLIKKRYLEAKEMYKNIGVDVDAAIKRVKSIPISINCWQGDDVKGFLKKKTYLSGGILATGDYLGAATNAKELQSDLSKVLSLIPGKHKVNLHAMYVDTDEDIDLDEIEPRHFQGWIDWAKKEKISLDFNPTLFSHPMFKNGFTLSHSDETVRRFWIEHCKKSIEIAEYFGKEFNTKCVNNLWIPDGYKDFAIDKYGPRKRLKESLDEIYSHKYDKKFVLNTMESKLFGIGIEAYTVGSNEFYLSYAVKNNIGLCMDMGHFHPTEQCSNKVSTVLNFIDELLLHVTRPMRWDSDHVVSLDDETQEMMNEILRNNFESRVYIALDFFDASINRLAAWVIGTRNVIKALIKASLEPIEKLKKYESENNYTGRLSILEEQKNYPWVDIWNYYCLEEGVPFNESWIQEIEKYEKEVLLNREGN